MYSLWALPVLIIGGSLAIVIGLWWLVTLGWGDVLFWVAVAAGVIAGGLTLYMVIQVSILTRQPLPALDRTVRTATVVLDGVRIGGESGPVKRGPGSPFLSATSKWTFEP